MDWIGERSGRGIVTDAITTPVVNTSAYFFNNSAQLIDFKVFFFIDIFLAFTLLHFLFEELATCTCI